MKYRFNESQMMEGDLVFCFQVCMDNNKIHQAEFLKKTQISAKQDICIAFADLLMFKMKMECHKSVFGHAFNLIGMLFHEIAGEF